MHSAPPHKLTYTLWESPANF